MDENAMDDDVLEPFEDEHAERRRIEQGTVPRVERQGRKGTLVLVRSQPNDGDGHAVTVRFSDAEWATIRRTVLAEHELRPLAEP